MVRKVKIGVVSCEVSKNEAKEVSRILSFPKEQRQFEFDRFMFASPTMEAKARRLAVGNALGLNTDKVYKGE